MLKTRVADKHTFCVTHAEALLWGPCVDHMYQWSYDPLVQKSEHTARVARHHGPSWILLRLY